MLCGTFLAESELLMVVADNAGNLPAAACSLPDMNELECSTVILAVLHMTKPV